MFMRFQKVVCTKNAQNFEKIKPLFFLAAVFWLCLKYIYFNQSQDFFISKLVWVLRAIG